MKRIILGIVTASFITAVITVFVIGLAFYQDYSTKKYVHQYYDDLIQGNYEGAFQHVHPWTDNPDRPLTITAENAKKIFMKRVSELKGKGYNIVSVSDIVVTERGSNLGADVNLTVKLQGQLRQYKERLVFYNAKIVVLNSQDPYAHYRDGKLAN